MPIQTACHATIPEIETAAKPLIESVFNTPSNVGKKVFQSSQEICQNF